MKLFLLSAVTLAGFGAPMTANAQLFGSVDNNTLLYGGAGAGLGAFAGSQIAPSGNRTEGAAIGAVAGGLLGAAYGNSQSTYYGNPYAGQFNPGFNQRNLIGAGIGAGLGGVIGSNIAGSGQRQEGTAIGAALGGLVGYGIANRTAQRPMRYGSMPQYPSYGPSYGSSYGQAYTQTEAQHRYAYGHPHQPRVTYAPAQPHYQPHYQSHYQTQAYYPSAYQGQIAPAPAWPSAPTYYSQPTTSGCSHGVCRRRVW